ncbi:MAG: peptide deformylase [Candidatus Hydrogenedentes bacterium]|nr:peptide deformylase [Candidatus Hydrogenedentota bacterium]
MAKMNIVLYPDGPLTKVATPYDQIGPEVAKLAADMFDTMYAQEGVGLAGPQVGVGKRIFVLHDPETDTKLCLVNPELSEHQGEALGSEGCLSLPELYAEIPRATRIHVRALDQFGKPLEFDAKDFLARIIQHENDHLDGIVILDRVDVLTRFALQQDWDRIRERMLNGACAERA